MDFDKIEDFIESVGWFYFGRKEFKCPGLRKEYMDYYKRNNKLLSPCDKCYKALIFWKDKYSRENLNNFFSMVDSFEVNYVGKLNRNVAVFYFRDKTEMFNFLKFLENKMQEFNVSGRIQWRKACKAYQAQKPELWKNAKEFIPDSQKSDISKFLY